MYFCRYEESDWGCYVIAQTPGKAKALFAEYWRNEGDFVDVRAKKVMANVVGDAGVYDVNCDTLLENGVKYPTLEEYERFLEG